MSEDGILNFPEGVDIFQALNRDIPTGLYLVQSTRCRSCYRAGAGGVDGEKSTLVNRLKQHRGTVPGWPDINWTEYHRRWHILWAVQLPGTSRLTGKLCESLFIGLLAQRYCFIPEAGESGFHATPDEAPNIVAFARSLEKGFSRIIRQQALQPRRQLWRYGAKEGPPSDYTGWIGEEENT